MALRLTIGFSDNPRVQPLKDGTVKPQNIELGFVTLDPSALTLRHRKFTNSSLLACAWPAYPSSEPPCSRDPEGMWAEPGGSIAASRTAETGALPPLDRAETNREVS